MLRRPSGQACALLVVAAACAAVAPGSASACDLPPSRVASPVSGQTHLSALSLLLTDAAAPPSSTVAPAVAGVAEEGRTLFASSGEWTDAPLSHAYQWHRCDPAGAGCVDIGGATFAQYVVGAADVGSTLRVAVTASNDAGASVAESAPTPVVVAATAVVFHRYATDGACSACRIDVLQDGTLRATVAGGSDAQDTAYAIADLGSPGVGVLYVRDEIGLAEGQTPAANLAVFQVRDGTDSVVYELYVAPDRTLRLWSPAGGLRATPINVNTGVAVPANGVSRLPVDVAAQPNGSLVVRTNGVVRVDLRGFTGASSVDQRYLRAGIEHYDGTSANAITVDHAAIAVSRAGWPEAPTSGQPPQNTVAPSVDGVAVEGGLLTAEPGTWSTSVALGYRWRRCDVSGVSCSDIAGATARSYRISAADIGAALLVRVTATNGSGSRTVESAATEPVQADVSPVLNFAREEIPLGLFAQPTDTSNVGDLNADGRPDAVASGESYLAWYENPDWTPHLIAEGGYGEGSGIAVRDLDGDGSQDVIVAEDAIAQMVWFANEPGGWRRHLLSTELCHNMDFADLDGDGRDDIACADSRNGQVVWLEAPVDPTLPWTTRVIDPNRSVWGAEIADIDRDGRPDIVSGRAWYRNTGGSTWPRHPYTGLRDAARPGETFAGSLFDDHSYVTVLDIDDDGRLDIFSTLFAGSPEGEVWAFLAPADPLVGSWRAVQVDPGPLFSVHSQALLGSSPPTVAIAEMAVGGFGFGVNPDPEMYVYALSGPPDDPSSWRRTAVDHFGTHEVQATDVDGDGLVDLMGGQENYDLLLPPQTGGLYWWQNTTDVSPAPPQSVDLPEIAGLAREANILRGSKGSWTGTRPLRYDYAWRRCDESGGSCADIDGATDETYTATETDIGARLRLRVSATSDFGSAVAESAPTDVVGAAVVHLTFDDAVTDTACVGCTVAFDALGLAASIEGAADNVDTAYGVMDFGGEAGLSGPTYVRTVVQLPQGQTLAANLAVLQVRDTGDELLYEIYLSRDRTIWLWSPPGGLRPAPLSLSTGAPVPNDGAASVRIEVAAAQYAAVTVRIDGVDRISVPAYAGPTGGGQRRLRAGIDHYDGTSTVERVAIRHSFVAVGALGWFGAPGAASTPPLPFSPPVLSGVAEQDQPLQTSAGSWSGNPVSYTYRWLRCGVDGEQCSPIAGAVTAGYTPTQDDIGSTLRTEVVAVNDVGPSAPAVSAPSVVVAALQPPANVTLPAVSGVARQGETLVASTGTWSREPTSFGYRWLRCEEGNTCSPIEGAGESTYGLTAAEVGRTVRIEVTARNAGGTGIAESLPSAVVDAATPPPAVVNLALNSGFESDPAGSYSTHGTAVFSWASDAAFSGSRSLKIVSSSTSLSRWFSVIRLIRAEPGRAYSVSAWLRTLSAQDGSVALNFWSGAGAHLGTFSSAKLLGTQPFTSLSVRATAPAGTASLRVEFRLNGKGTLWADDVFVTDGAQPPPPPPEPPAPPVAVSSPVLSGVAEQARVLSASTGVWSGGPTAFAYQWRRCDAEGAACVDLPAASASSYLLAASDVGGTVRVRVTASNPAGSAVAESAASAVVAAAAVVNLAPNSGFESDPAGSYSTHGTAVFSWASDAAFSGSRSLKIVSSSTSLSRWLSVTRLIRAEPGRSYLVSAWLRTSLAQEGSLVLNFWSGAGVHLGTFTSARLLGTQPFTQLSVRATAPAGTANLRVEFRLNGKGTLWADELTVAAS